MKLLVLAGLAALAVPALAEGSPPAAPIEVVVDDYFGTRVSDPYRWMESGKDPRWMPWLKAQADHTRSVLDALPGRAGYLAETTRLTGDVAQLGAASIYGDTVIFTKRPVGAEDSRIYVRTGSAAPRELFDVNAHGNGKLAQDWMRASPDGRTIALGLSQRGTENSTIYLLDVASGNVTDTGIAQAQVVGWLPDSSGFTYIKMIGTAGQPDYWVNLQPRLYRIASKDDRLLVPRERPPVPITPQQRPFVYVPRKASGAILVVSDGRPESALYTADAGALLRGTAEWRRVADFPDLIAGHSAWGDRLWLLSRKGDGNGRIFLTSLGKPSLAGARAIDLPGNPVINFISAVGDTLVAETVGEGGQTALLRVFPDGRSHRIALPFVGSAAIQGSSDGNAAALAMEGWFTGRSLFVLGADDRITDLGLGDPSPIDPALYEAKVLTAKASDGTAIPFTVVARKGLRRDGANPTLLEAYGSYGSVDSPFYHARMIPYLDRGGVFVLASVRGGGEFGRAWHEAGRARNKATTWRDAIAVAEALIETGVTSRERLTLLGTSAGGVMVGGAINERPDLFSGAVANVGFMNPIRYVSEQNYADIEEWGGPIADADSFKTMFALDAYNNIKPGTRYPATLVVSGLNDPRAATFHSAKYAARLASATASDEPVLLRIDFDAGHGMGSRRSQLDATWADIFAFTLWQGGHPDFQPRPAAAPN